MQQQLQFRKNALGRNVADERTVELRARKTRFVGREPRLRRKARKAQKSQPVLAEHLLRGGHGPEDPRADIGNAAQRVDVRSRRDVIVDGVGAEVPPPRVEGDVRRERDFAGRVHAAHILVRAEAGELIAHALSVRELDRARVPVHGANSKAALLRSAGERIFGRGRGEVPVRTVCKVPGKKVAHAPAHHIERGVEGGGKRLELFGKDALHADSIKIC